MLLQKFKLRETWTHTFCLANREQIVAPSVVLKASLQQVGLGRKKICFNWKATAADVKTKLEEVYPKLKSGYSVPFLQDTTGLGQAIVFIRPIQINLKWWLGWLYDHQIIDLCTSTPHNFKASPIF